MDPRSIDTFGEQFPAVLQSNPAVLMPKNANASGVQKQSFTSREKY
jgi:hypothetical protein